MTLSDFAPPEYQRYLTAKAPDGSEVTVDLEVDDGTRCGAFAMYGCTLNDKHPGPWHIADSGTKILEVWPVEGTDGEGTA